MIYGYKNFVCKGDVTNFLQELEEDGIDPMKNVISISESFGQCEKHFTVWYRKKDNNRKDNKKKKL